MKKILAFIFLIVGIYLLLIFISPVVANNIGEKIGLLNFNNNLIETKKGIEDFIVNFDLVGKISETKKDALEIKQNVETQVQETKQKIETIQTNVDKTAKAIDQTTKAVNETVNSLNELQKSIGDVVPSIGTGTTNSGVQN